MLKLLQPICIFLPQLWVNMFINSLQQRHSFIKSHHLLFWVWQGKVKKDETTSTTSKVEKGTDHYLSRGGGGGSSEDIICITINFTWFPMRLCNLMIPFHWQLVGTQFCLAPHPTLWSVGNQFPWKPCDHPKILWTPSPWKENNDWSMRTKYLWI